ncbi:MAG: MFS transporter [Rudaea sp.]|uniref:spinster family MFS transporter n=1 Tax=Rudaea sp. TaxID=2136325 RepID=UPI0039E38DF9
MNDGAVNPGAVAAASAQREAGGVYRWYVVGVLLLAYCLSALDQRVLSLMVGPIKHDLGLSDFQIGLLQGFAFALLYSFVGIPLGRLVDGSRRRPPIVVCGIALWSLATAACGFARGFGALFAARVAVGVGEATLGPAAYSLISDYFERNRRALAISFFAIGYPVGGAIALILGAHLLEVFGRGDVPATGLLAGLHPWQMVFVALGIPGILVALLVATIREPARRNLAPGYGDRTIPLPEALRFIVAHWRVYGMLLGSGSLIALLAIGVSLWYPAFLMRTYRMTTGEVGLYYGTVMLVCGTIGTLCGGWLGGWLARRGRRDANMRVVLFSTILKGLPLIVSPLMPNATLALAFMALGTLIGQASQGVLLAAVQDVTPNRLRGQVSALTLFAISLFGFGLGASFIAAITDFVFHDEGALRYSIAITGAIMLPLIVLLIVLGMPAYRRALAEMEEAR